MLTKSVYLLPLLGLLHGHQVSCAELHGFIGTGLEYAPVYSGARQYSVQPGFQAGGTIQGEHWGALTLSSDGVEWDLSPDTPFSASLLVYIDDGRDEVISTPFSHKENNELKGMGDLPDIPMAGVSVSYKMDALALWFRGLAATRTREYGGVPLGRMYKFASGGQFTMFELQNEALSVGSDLTWASSGYQQGHFGVSAQQALTTRFDKYTPGSGLQSGGIYTDLTYRLTDHLIAGLNLRADYLFDKAARSPLVDKRTGYSVGSLIQYSF
ncbi:TPA: MipA/OmpV family protein [Klebsiella pneumoniae]|nr:MipA/OmpV family protein [Klebsiella pneumoniae]